MKREIVQPEIGRNAQDYQMFEQCILRRYRKTSNFGLTFCNPAGRPFFLSQEFPRSEETIFSARHGPGRMPLVQESLAPFNQFTVDLIHDLTPQGGVTPRRQG